MTNNFYEPLNYHIMKNVLFGLMISLVAIIVTSCGFKSEETSLYGNLVSFTAPGENKEDVLLGVKDKASDRVIITPAYYEEITADANLIICRVSGTKLEVYRHDGEPLGKGTFDTFTKMPQGNMYLGTNYSTNTYYFPAEDYIICTESYLTGLKQLFLRIDSGEWEIRDYEGKLIWKTPKLGENKKYWVIKDIKAAGETFYVAVSKSKGTPACVLYDLTGKEVKKLNASKWRFTQKKLQNSKDLDANTTYAEFENISKF